MHFRSTMYVIVAVCCPAIFLNAAEWETDKVAQKHAADWLRKRDDKIVLAYETADKSAGFVGSAITSSPDTMYVLGSDGWQVTLGLKGKLQADDTAASLQERLKFIALDTIPTPGLVVKGWEIKPLTPVSTIREGVEIREYKDGFATIVVKTSCFCLSGAVRRDLLGHQPADAGLPKGTYFQLRQDIPLEVTFRAPLSFSP